MYGNTATKATAHIAREFYGDGYGDTMDVYNLARQKWSYNHTPGKPHNFGMGAGEWA